MNIVATWFINLPFDLTCRNQFYNTRLTNFVYQVEEVEITFIKEFNSESINKIVVKTNRNYDEKYLPSVDYMDYLIDFTNATTLRAGLLTQRFFDGISKATKDDELKLFDGEDFCVDYRLEMSNGIMSGSYQTRRDKYNIDDEKMEKALQFCKRDNNYLDNAWYLLREVSVGYELGKYEICFLNMAIMLELLITTKLNNYLGSKGKFKSPYREQLKDKYGEYPSFVDKHFIFGLSLVTCENLNQDLLNSIDIIYKIRDKVAHGSPLFEISLLSKNNIDRGNIKSFIWQLYNDIIEIYNFFYDLDNKNLNNL